jgi:streptogramin lyase
MIIDQRIQTSLESAQIYGRVTRRSSSRSSNGLARLLFAVGLVGAAGLAGCSGGISSGLNQLNTAGAAARGIGGSVFGGQQPISGATIQLYTVGTTGLGSASTALISASVKTDANGNFTISPNDIPLYSCTNATQVYITATGGINGYGSVPNAASGLMAPLGLCTGLSTSSYIQLNELTTVAAVFALAPYMTSYTSIGASGSNPIGLSNAVANFNNLVNLNTGNVGGASLPSGATVPAAEIDTLADIIAACVNSTGPGSTACTMLLTATGATETIGAALAFAKNPTSSSLTALWNVGIPSAPFQPVLSAAPADWSMAITFTGQGTLNSPSAMAIDAVGNVWITNGSTNIYNSIPNSIVKLASTGGLFNQYAVTGLVGANGVAIDMTGNVWVANTPTNTLLKLSSAGTLLASCNGGGLNGPTGMAIDSANNIWLANQNGNSVSEFNSSCVSQAGLTGFTGGGTINLPTSVALDGTGNVWVANYGNSNLVELTHAGASATGSPFTDNALQGPSALAVDGSGNVWLGGNTTGSAIAGAVSQFSNAGVASASGPLSGGGLLYPSSIATSGSQVFAVNRSTGLGLSLLTLGQSTPTSGSTGIGASYLNTPTAVAVDPSGDVWVANGNNTVAQFIGLTAPVITPLAANVGP